MKTFSILIALLFITVCSHCQSFQLGIGTGFNHGNSGGCSGKSGTGVLIETAYYFGDSDGLGIALELSTPGYTDCNDGDPLIFLSPQLRFRKFIKQNRSAIHLGVGYATGIFIDPGYNLKFGLQLYSKQLFFLRIEQSYYRAFKPKPNAIMPGTSSNLGTTITAGIYL